MDDGDVVLGPHRFRENVANARGFEDGADAAAGDDAGAGTGRAEEYLAAVVFTQHFVRMVSPLSFTDTMLLRACSVLFRMASGTSLALP